MRFSHKLFLTLFLLIAFTISSFIAVLYLKSQHELQQLSSSYGESLVEQVAQFAAEPLFAKDLLSLNVVVSQLQDAEHIAYAAILDTQRKPIAEIGNKPKETTKGTYEKSIRFQASRAGYAVVMLDQATIANAITGSTSMLLLVSLFILILSAVVIGAVAKHIMDGVAATTYAFRQLAQGQLGTEITTYRTDELGRLIESFNDLSRGLNERDQLLHPLPGQHMAKKHSLGLSNGFIHITQMYVDLSEISRHIEKLSADGCAELLNIYNQIITIAAHHYDSDICRFDREGIAIRFLASDPHQAANACLDAICASQLALRLIDRLNQSRFERHLPTIRVAIGIHHSFGFASHIVNNSQNNKQQQYQGYTAFLSDVDNDAARLAKSVQKGRVGISQAAADIANAGSAIQLSQHQVQPMTDFYSELRFSVISGLSPQLRKPIQIQADEIFNAIYPRVILTSLEPKPELATEAE